MEVEEDEFFGEMLSRPNNRFDALDDIDDDCSAIARCFIITECVPVDWNELSSITVRVPAGSGDAGSNKSCTFVIDGDGK